MIEISTISKVINTFTETTQIPVMYLDNLKSIPTVHSENFNYLPVLEYGDFVEILEYLDDLFIKQVDEYPDICTFRTQNCLLYIVAVNKDPLNKGAFVAGPMLPYSPDKRMTEDLITNKSLPLHRKAKYEALIRTLPFVSEARIGYLAQLLLILSQSQEKYWYSTVHEVGNKDSNTYVYSIINENYKNGNEDTENHFLYSFSLKIKEKIMQGNMDGIIDLLNNHSNLFWMNKTNDETHRILKNRCIVLISVSSVFAIQANAPYKRIMSLTSNFLINIHNMKSPQEIILKTANILETLAYLVSISNGNNYSLHIKRVMQYIKSHYKEKITLKKLAEYVNLNSVYLSSLIKKETSLSLLENINLIRIEEGKNLLIFTQKSIQEISYTLGYNYQNHFNNVFKKFTGMTPLEFRQNYGRNSFGI